MWCFIFHKLGVERFAGAEHDTRFLEVALNRRCVRVRAAEHAPRDAFNLLERIYGLV